MRPVDVRSCPVRQFVTPHYLPRRQNTRPSDVHRSRQGSVAPKLRKRERCSAAFLHGCLLNKISQSISGISHSSCCNMRFIFLRLSSWSWPAFHLLFAISSHQCLPSDPTPDHIRPDQHGPDQSRPRPPRHSAQLCSNRWLHVCKDNLIIAKCSIV